MINATIQFEISTSQISSSYKGSCAPDITIPLEYRTAANITETNYDLSSYVTYQMSMTVCTIYYHHHMLSEY